MMSLLSQNQEDYLEADEASMIVSAAEVVAKLLGKGIQKIMLQQHKLMNG